MPELLFAGGHLTKKVERDAAELAACVGKVVCHVRSSDIEFESQVGVRSILVVSVQVVALEEPKVDDPAARLAFGTQSVNRHLKSTAYPLLLKKVLNAFRRRQASAFEFAFGQFEVQREHRYIPAAFLRAGAAVLVLNEGVHAAP